MLSSSAGAASLSCQASSLAAPGCGAEAMECSMECSMVKDANDANDC